MKLKKLVAAYRYLGTCNGSAQYEYDNYTEECNRDIELNLFGETIIGMRLNDRVAWMDPELTKIQNGANVESVSKENYWASASDGYLTQGDPHSQLSITVDF